MMAWLTQLRIDVRRRAAALFRRGALRDRLDEEMRFHLETRIARLVEDGVAPDEARVRAAREFGHLLVTRERSLDMWRYGAMERFLQDVRYAVRMLRRAPGFTVVAVLSLALGIGANAAIFSLIDRVMLRLLPVDAPEELVIVNRSLSYPRYEFFRDRTHGMFRGVTAFSGISGVTVDGNDDSVSLAEGRLVSGTYFSVLGVRAPLGRLLGPDDDRVPGAHPVAVISHAFWRRYFQGDPAVLGRTVKLSPGTLSSGAGTNGFETGAASGARPAFDGRFTIVGVAPPGFVGETIGQHPDFWVPLMMQEHFMPGRPWLQRKSASWLRVMARLDPGVPRAAAQSAATLVWQQAMIEEGGALTAQDRRAIEQTRIELQDGDRGRSPLRGEFSQPLIVLMAMVGVVLLIACANLANLLLARASARQREISIRLATGASRGRIIRQLVTESLVLALLGGAAGVAVAWWGSQTMFAMVSEGDPGVRLDLAPDLRTLAFTAGVSLLTALLFGLVPALRATRVDVIGTLRDGGRSSAPAGSTIGRALVTAQVALSVMLLIGTGLFTRTLYNMKAQDFGYPTEQVLLMQVDPISAGFTGDAIGRTCQTLLEKIRALPGVRAATFSENGLFSGTESGASIRIDGYTPPDERASSVRFDQVGPGYFSNLGIPLRLGRELTEADHATAPRVVVINDVMAKFYFGDRNPIGQVVHSNGADGFALTIVGVVADARDHSLRDPVQRRMYVSFLQPVDGLTTANYEVRTAVDPAVMATQLRAAVTSVAPRMPILRIKPLSTLVNESILRERMIARLSVLLGVVAVVLASVGLYGVLAYSVARRTSEIGIRMAIGAFPRTIVWMVLRETFALVAIGVVVGVPLALGASRYVESLLYGLTPTDAVTIVGVIALMTAIALVAAFAPARRAARVDPLRALRYE
jgi:predicted permease